MNTIQHLAPAVIAPSRTNPRKHFNEAAMAELVASVAGDGVLHPLLVRPLAGPFRVGKAVTLPGDGNKVWGVHRGSIGESQPVVLGLTKREAEAALKQYIGVTHELIAGERRLRAAITAKLAEVPVIVLDVDDRKACELQVIENAQRSDLHPMEEAEGYEALMQQHGLTVEEIAAKVGKSTSAIYARLKLCDLCEPARQALYQDNITAGLALLIARIPHPDLQAAALKEITTGWGGPMTLREASDLVQRDYMLRLKAAPFDPKDKTLLPEAGPCSTCPKRTGNQPELFADVEAKDVCTDPKCFAAKREAAHARRIAAHEAAGGTVLPTEQAKNVFAYGHVKSNSRFTTLDDVVPAADYEPLSKVLKKQHLPPVTLAVDERGKLHELVEKAAVAEALKAAGIEDKRKPSGDEQQRARAKKKKLLEVVALRAVPEILKGLLEGDPDDKMYPTADAWRLLLLVCRDRASLDQAVFVTRRRGLAQKATEARKALDEEVERLIQRRGTPGQAALVVELLLCTSCVSGWDPAFYHLFKQTASAAGVDLKALTAEVKAEAEAGAKKPRRRGGAEKVDPRDGSCEKCGCTIVNACLTTEGPCHWVRNPTATKPGLCSACAPPDAVEQADADHVNGPAKPAKAKGGKKKGGRRAVH